MAAVVAGAGLEFCVGSEVDETGLAPGCPKLMAPAGVPAVRCELDEIAGDRGCSAPQEEGRFEDPGKSVLREGVWS